MGFTKVAILSIFSSKKLPIAGLAAICLITAVEIASATLISTIKSACLGGDMIRFDQSLFCENLHPFALRSTFLARAAMHQKNKKFPDLIKEGPYDVVAFGDSTGTTGWLEKIAQRRGLKVANLTRVEIGEWPAKFVEVARNANALSPKAGTIWLLTSLTERQNKTFVASEPFSDALRHDQQKSKKEDLLPSARLMKYLDYRKESRAFGGVAHFSLGAHEQLFLQLDLNGLHNQNAENEAALLTQFVEAREIAARAGAQLIFVLFPTKAQQYEWLIKGEAGLNYASSRAHLNQIKRACEAAGIPVFDIEQMLLPLSKKTYEETGELLWFPDDTHMNETAADYVAKYLGEEIIKIHDKMRN